MAPSLAGSRALASGLLGTSPLSPFRPTRASGGRRFITRPALPTRKLEGPGEHPCPWEGTLVTPLWSGHCASLEATPSRSTESSKARRKLWMSSDLT